MKVRGVHVRIDEWPYPLMTLVNEYIRSENKSMQKKTFM